MMNREKAQGIRKTECDMIYRSDRLPYELSEGDFQALVRVFPQAREWTWKTRIAKKSPANENTESRKESGFAQLANRKSTITE